MGFNELRWGAVGLSLQLVNTSTGSPAEASDIFCHERPDFEIRRGRNDAPTSWQAWRSVMKPWEWSRQKMPQKYLYGTAVGTLLFEYLIHNSISAAMCYITSSTVQYIVKCTSKFSKKPPKIAIQSEVAKSRPRYHVYTHVACKLHTLLTMHCISVSLGSISCIWASSLSNLSGEELVDFEDIPLGRVKALLVPIGTCLFAPFPDIAWIVACPECGLHFFPSTCAAAVFSAGVALEILSAIVTVQVTSCQLDPDCYEKKKKKKKE